MLFERWKKDRASWDWFLNGLCDVEPELGTAPVPTRPMKHGTELAFLAVALGCVLVVLLYTARRSGAAEVGDLSGRYCFTSVLGVLTVSALTFLLCYSELHSLAGRLSVSFIIRRTWHLMLSANAIALASLVPEPLLRGGCASVSSLLPTIAEKVAGAYYLYLGILLAIWLVAAYSQIKSIRCGNGENRLCRTAAILTAIMALLLLLTATAGELPVLLHAVCVLLVSVAAMFAAYQINRLRWHKRTVVRSFISGK